MKPTAARQRREAHRTRLALPRALHQLLAMRRAWMREWGRGRRPGRIKLPHLVRKPTVSISKGPLRKHRLALMSALLRA